MKGLWAGFLGVGEGGVGRFGENGPDRAGLGQARAGRSTAPSPQNLARVSLRESDSSERPPTAPTGNSRFMAKRVVRNPKPTIGKTKQLSPVILKGSPVKNIKSTVVGRLRTRERKMLLAIARVLAEK